MLTKSTKKAWTRYKRGKSTIVTRTPERENLKKQIAEKAENAQKKEANGSRRKLKFDLILKK